jgi:2-phosphosulfolactate phosphatase
MPSVVIDCFPAAAERYTATHTIVAVDVIRATTTMITAVESGWRCIPVATLEDAISFRAKFPDAVLAGELGGNVPDGFDLNNSPAQVATLAGRGRRLVLLSTSGTDLLCRSRAARAAYAACLRNYAATARWLANQHDRVAIIGAGSRNEFREEDQMCCAWLAEQLIEAGFVSEDEQTLDVIERWHGLPIEACLVSNSVDYLHRSGQTDDLDFVLSHVNDVDCVFAWCGDEVVPIYASMAAPAIASFNLVSP